MTDDVRAEKEAFLTELQSCDPPSVRFIRWASRLLHLPGFATILVVCFLPYLIGVAIAAFEEDGIARHTVFWLRVNIFMISAGGLILLDFIHRRALVVAREAVRPLQEAAEVRRLRDSYCFMFASRAQYWLYLLFGVPAIVTIVLFLGIPFTGALWAFYIVNTVLTLFLLTNGLWIAIGLIHLAGNYARSDSIRFNLVEPLNTPGVREMAGLSTTMGISFVVEAMFVVVGLWLAPWAASEKTVFLTSAAWSAFILVATAVTIIWPKVLLRSLLDRGKSRRLEWFQDRLEQYEDQCFDIPLEEIERRERALTLLREYNELHARIARARTSALDWQTALKLVGSLAVPILVFLAQNPDAFARLGEMFGRGPG